MRALRRDIDDPDGRSSRIWDGVRDTPSVRAASVVMVFASIAGEPETASFIDWCRREGKRVILPDADPAAPPPESPEHIDVVIVPGVAFTEAGDRLGQGGGWYDRVLASVRPDCVAIGVCFVEQVVDAIPVEPHDRRVDVVVTDAIGEKNASGGGDPPIPSARDQ